MIFFKIYLTTATVFLTNKHLISDIINQNRSKNSFMLENVFIDEREQQYI